MKPLRQRDAAMRPLRDVIRLCQRHSDLIWEMARREIADRYAGQALGVFWAFCHPIFLISLYVFIFAFVFKQKIGGTSDMPLDYTAYLLSGLVAWLSIQDGLIKSCTIITSNKALVKQTVFPLEVLVIKSMAVSMFPQLISAIILIGYVLVTHGSLHLTYLLLPILVTLQLFGMVGIAFLLAPLGAYLRDMKDVMQLFAAAGGYLLPVFYLPAWVPELFRPILYFNPFSYIIWCYQDTLYFGRFEHPWSWVITVVFNLMVFDLGYRFFRKLKPTLGNLL
jgi:lipopolysaccharide transport system permease protein